MRINLYGGPGSGKSTTAAWLFSELKLKGHSIELVTEFVKVWAYKRIPIKKWDQFSLFGIQMQREFDFLSNGVKNVVSDSPLLLNIIYTKIYQDDAEFTFHLEHILREYEREYPSLNIILERKDKPYAVEGRYETPDQAVTVDNWVKKTVPAFYKNDRIFTSDYRSREDILNFVINKLGK